MTALRRVPEKTPIVRSSRVLKTGIRVLCPQNFTELKGWEINDLAKEYGVSRGTVRYWEWMHGYTLDRICLCCEEQRSAAEMKRKSDGSLAQHCIYGKPAKALRRTPRPADTFALRQIIKPWPNQAKTLNGYHGQL